MKEAEVYSGMQCWLVRWYRDYRHYDDDYELYNKEGNTILTIVACHSITSSNELSAS